MLADHLKLTFPMSWAVTQIAWSVIDGRELLKHGTYDGRNNYVWALQTLLHGVDYLLRCHVADDALVVQVRFLPTYSTCFGPVSVRARFLVCRACRSRIWIVLLRSLTWQARLPSSDTSRTTVALVCTAENVRMLHRHRPIGRVM